MSCKGGLLPPLFVNSVILLLVQIVCAVNIKESNSTTEEWKGDGKGHRLVDGLEIDPDNRFGFLVIFNFYPVHYAKCTGVLIAKTWVITAAHCAGSRKLITLDDCGSALPHKLRCSETTNKDLRVDFAPSKYTPKVYFGVHNLNDKKKGDLNSVLVKYMIRHRHSYPGGSYGGYGGYDLILVKLKQPVPQSNMPICLSSSPDFCDRGRALAAGFGRYRRAPCEVGPRGPDKFEFCGTGTECVVGEEAHQTVNCSIQWEYEGRKVTECSHEATPSSSHPECQKFVDSVDFVFPKDVEDVVIIKKGSNGGWSVVTTCFQTSPGSYGWCGTIRDFVSFKDQVVDVKYSSGWGFCQRSCHLDMSIPLGGIERINVVDIISDDYCAETIPEGLEIRPEVLCIAHNRTFNTFFYQQTKGGYKDVRNELSEQDQLLIMNRTRSWYIVGTGSCKGDSGGALFKVFSEDEGKRKNVLVGTTSRGTGHRGNCGGMDNPTHFVRVKYFMDWIKEYVPADEMCLLAVENLEEIDPDTIHAEHME